MMDSSTQLDHFLFQLTPTRTRCDLVIFAGKSNEKLAHGLLEPFTAHLKSVKDQISKGGYSVVLRPNSGSITPWFTKGTLQRFVRFVSTPEVLERFVTIERDIEQLENSIKSYEVLYADGIETEGDGTSVGGNSKNSPTSLKVKEELNRSNDFIPEESSKARLQRVVETRKAVLQKEQAMVYARALAAGFEMDNLADLLFFSDAFGASRLREACVNFKDLCKKKNEDRMWVDEIAAMQAMVQPDLLYMGTSGIILAEDNDTSLGSQDASEEGAPALPKDPTAQMPNPWVNQFAPYLQNYRGPVYQQMPPYYPGMQVAPPYYPQNMQWTPNGDRESPEGHDYKKSSRRKKGRENEQDKSTEPSGSSSETQTDSSIEKSRKKKHGKKSSRKVVIRNLNYITSKRDGERNSSSESDSSDEDDVVDSKKQQKSSSHRRGKREELKHDDDDKGEKGNENWGAFQDLLLKEEPEPSPKSSTFVEEECLGNPKFVEQKQRLGATDAFLVTDQAGGDNSNITKLSIENFDPSESVRPTMKRGIAEEFLFAQRNAEPGYTHLELSDDAVRSSVKRSQGNDDWFINNHSNEAAGDDHFKLVDGEYRTLMDNRVEKKTKDVIIDDSLMIQRRLTDDSASQHTTITGLASDVVKASISENVVSEVPQKKSESQGFYEPDELFMVLDRDSSTEPLPSWTPEMDYENNVSVNDISKRQSDADINANLNTPSKDKTPKKEKNGASATKGLGKDARSRSLNGPLRKGKPDPTPARRSTFGSKTTNPKSLLEKKQEEERRKRMEELLIQRQKRIAERSAASRNDQSSTDETKKSKSVFRSSTIERLAAAKTTPKDATPVKKAVSKVK